MNKVKYNIQENINPFLNLTDDEFIKCIDMHIDIMSASRLKGYDVMMPLFNRLSDEIKRRGL